MSSPSEVDMRSSSAPPPKFRTSTPGQGQNSQYYTKDIDINNHPYTIEPVNGHSNGNHGNSNHSNQGVVNGNHSHGNKRFLSQVLSENTPDKRQRPVSAAPTVENRKHTRSVQRTSSYKEARKVYTKPLPRQQSPRQNCYRPESRQQNNPRLKPSFEYNLLDDSETDNEKSNNSGRNCVVSQMRVGSEDCDSVSSSGSDLDEDLTSDGADMIKQISGREKDNVLAEVIDIGDRVLISIPQKQPRYGKKRGMELFLLAHLLSRKEVLV